MSERIYQIFCGRWEQANVLEHPGEVLRRLETLPWKPLIQEFEFTHFYLLGLWDTSGPIIVSEEGGIDISNQEHRCPSPFAITDHCKISPLLGTETELRQLVATLHDLEIKVIVDFVPNHTGKAHTWVTEHPEFYKINHEGSIQAAFSGDVLELDYTQAEVCQQMTNVLTTIAGFGVDGVRCDMAHLVPDTFWKTVIHTVKGQFPNFTFLAEAYSKTVFDLTPLFVLLAAGFDAVYDEPLYRNLVAYAHGGPVEHVLAHMEFVKHTYPRQWIHYLSNHDDACPLQGESIQKWQHKLFELPGWQLLYNGTLWGHTGRLAHHYVELLPAAQTGVEPAHG